MGNPPIFVREVRVSGFRALANVAVVLGEITVLVGENNVGKSAFLRALQVGLGAQATEDDFHVRSNGERVAGFGIDVKFEPWPGEEFSDVVVDIVGTRMLGLTDDDPYFAWRVSGSISSDGSGVTVSRNYLTTWPGTDPVGVPVGRNDSQLISFFLLDANRDFAADQKSIRSFWGQLLSDIEVPTDLRLQIEKELKQLGDKVVGSSELLAAAQTDLDQIASTLGTSIRSVGIEALPARVVEVARSVDVVVASPSGHSLPMRFQGQGTRSVASILAFHAFTRLRLGKGEDVKPVVVAGFEEPEAHLHPQAQRAVFSLIQSMSGQRLLATHSPLATRHIHLSQLVMMRTRSAGVDCLQIHEDDLKPPQLSVSDLEKLERMLLRHHSESLFARLVILVEGDTEEIAVPIFAKFALGCDLESACVTVINVHGSGNYRNYTKSLDLLGVPFFLLADGDAAGQDGVAAAVNHLGSSLGPDELAILPDGLDFEAFLIDSGHLDVIVQAVENEIDYYALVNYMTKNHGTKGKGGAIRDYNAPGWERTVVLDYCHDNKALCAGPVARGIVKSLEAVVGEWGRLPSPIDRMFDVVVDRTGLVRR